MNLRHLLMQRDAEGKPLLIGLIGAGKFGSMFLSQVRTTPGMHLVGVADLSPDRARKALERTGWAAERIAATSFAQAIRQRSTRVTDDAGAMIAAS